MKRLAFILLTGFVILSQLRAQDYVFRSRTDLNSDGIAETIVLENSDEPYRFTLRVNDTEIAGEMEIEYSDGFAVIDIDATDKHKEIAVHTLGPSDFNMHIIYWYNGNELLTVGKLVGSPVFNGNGIVYLDFWHDFFIARDKYVLDKTSGSLNVSGQFAYYVGIKAKAKEGFIIYRETNLAERVAVLSDGSEIEIILCRGNIYLIRSASGLTGWTDEKTIVEKTEGLVWAG